MRMSCHIRPAGLLAAGCLLLLGGALHSQDEISDTARRPEDTTFYEIHLDPTGVTAVDTAGYHWHYDFQTGSFAPGEAPTPELGDIPGEAFTDDLPVEVRCTEKLRVKPFQSKIRVGYEEYVEGDITALERVTIRGWVKGDVRCLNGRVYVSSSGRVDGDVEAPDVIVRNGATILGEIRRTTDPVPKFKEIARSFSADGLIVVTVFTVTLLFFGLITALLMPHQLENFGRCVRQHRVKTFMLGLFFVFFFPAIVVLVIITVVGLLIVPLVPVLYLFAIGLGLVTFGNLIGRLFARRYLGGERSLLAQSVLGMSLLMSLWYATAVLLGANDKVSQGFGIFFLVVSILLTTYPVMTGVGAAVLTRFGFREYRALHGGQKRPGVSGAPTPAPPPLPDGPPSGTTASRPVSPPATPASQDRNYNHEDKSDA